MERSAERGLPCLTRYSLLGLSKNLVFSAVKHFVAVAGGGGAMAKFSPFFAIGPQ